MCRDRGDLASRDPLAGYQLVKGTIDIDEGIEQAAERELLEESGLSASPLPTWVQFKWKNLSKNGISLFVEQAR